MSTASNTEFLVRWAGILFSFYSGSCLSLDQVPAFPHKFWPVCEMEGTLSASDFSLLECVHVLYLNMKCFDLSGGLKGVWQYLLHTSLLLLQLHSSFIPLRLSQSLLLAGTRLLQRCLIRSFFTQTVLLPFFSPQPQHLPEWTTVGKQNDEESTSLGCILFSLCPKPSLPLLVYPLSPLSLRQPGPSSFPKGPECGTPKCPNPSHHTPREVLG